MVTKQIDVEKARSDTPACENVIHFNNAGASLMPEPVLNSLIGHLRLETRIGGYEAESQEKKKIEAVYDTIASLINASPIEVALIENATRAWDMAFYSIPFIATDRILTARAEYASNFLAYLQIAKRYGTTIDVIPNDKFGQVSIEELKQMIDDDVKLISITHVPTNSGLVNPIEKIGDIANEHNIIFLIDACQSVGQLPIDVKKIGCDILSATGRKYLRGPRGTGFLFMNENLIEKLEPPFVDLHAATWLSEDQFHLREDARRFENWESYVSGKLALGEAVSYAANWGLENIWFRIQKLGRRFRQRLGNITGVELNDIGRTKCGIISFNVEGRDPRDVKVQLNKNKINVSISSKEATRLDMVSRSLDSVIRASVHYYNTEEEIDQFCEVIETFV
ncbi:MAG: aminotransferase class V-fold PLP-dependent enzyme [Candidatus Heimdallarchaeota archaeon]